MSTTVEFECWAWISKRGDDCDSVTFEANKFKKRKKRWISVTENRLVYSKTAKKSDMKYIPLEHSTAIKTFNESNLEVRSAVYQLCHSPLTTCVAVLAHFVAPTSLTC
jgi:hypothetical protein